jgi:hypothetical protein
LHNLADEKPEVIDYAKQEPDTVARLRKLHDDWAKDIMPK